MALHDYAEMDEEDYYGQEFEKEGVLSLWVGMKDDSDLPDADVLQDLCGVGYYDLDQQRRELPEFRIRAFDRGPV